MCEMTTEKSFCSVRETWGKQNQGQDRREKEGENAEGEKRSMVDAEKQNGLSKERHDSKQVWSVQNSFR